MGAAPPQHNRCHLPLPPHPLHPLPYPHAHPHAPHDSSFLRRAEPPLRRQGNLRRPPPPTAVVVQASRAYAAGRPGESRGGFPLWQGVWGMCPHFQKTSEGWVGGPNQRRHADPSLPPPLGAGLALRLVSLCRFLAILHRGPRPPFGPRPGRYDLSPFVDFSHALQRGPRPPVRPVPGSYDLSPFVHLSVAPQTQAAPRPSRHRPAGKNAQHNSKQVKPPFDQGIGGECYRASPRKGPTPCGS